MNHKNQRRRAFALVELLSIIAILGIVVAIFIAGRQKEKARAHRVTCNSNLKVIGAAFRLSQPDIVPGGGIYLLAPEDIFPGVPDAASILALTNGASSPYTYQLFGVMSNELSDPKLIVCPADRRVAQTNLSMMAGNSTDASKLLNQHVSYFVGRDVQEPLPQMIQAGDRNLGTGETGPNSAYGYSPNPEINTGFAKELGTNNATVRWTATMHNNQGNVLFADGHVEGLSSLGFRRALSVTGDPNATATKGNLILFL